MKIELKLFATLADYLPANAKDNIAFVDLPDGMTVQDAMEHFNLPQEQCHLVILNGVFVLPERRRTEAMKEGDTLALWPPVAGG